MAISFTEINNRKNVLYVIPNESMTDYKKIIDLFNDKFDDLFDIYSDFRLYENHIEYLLQLIKLDQNSKLNSFSDFLLSVKLSGTSILVIGD